MKALRALPRGLIHLFYPRLCEGCRKPLMGAESVLCLHCETLFPLTGFHHIQNNEAALRFLGRFTFEHATALAYFTEGGILEHMLYGLKYSGKKQIGLYLGRKAGLDIRNSEWPLTGMIPVPLHHKKQTLRGYNQSTILAEGIREITGIPVITKAIIRQRFTESQTVKTREQRILNLQDVFKITRPEVLKGQHLLIVDDVITTGATIEALALKILEVPGVKISIMSAGLRID